MKKIFLSFCFIIAALLTANGQDKKAEREAAAQAAFERPWPPLRQRIT